MSDWITGGLILLSVILGIWGVLAIGRRMVDWELRKFKYRFRYLANELGAEFKIAPNKYTLRICGRCEGLSYDIEILENCKNHKNDDALFNLLFRWGRRRVKNYLNIRYHTSLVSNAFLSRTNESWRKFADSNQGDIDAITAPSLWTDFDCSTDNVKELKGYLNQGNRGVVLDDLLTRDIDPICLSAVRFSSKGSINGNAIIENVMARGRDALFHENNVVTLEFLVFAGESGENSVPLNPEIIKNILNKIAAIQW